MPVDIGSVTQSTAAAASAASAALPPALERAQPGARRERLARRDHPVEGDGGRAPVREKRNGMGRIVGRDGRGAARPGAATLRR